jgi:hypothetical protein
MISRHGFIFVAYTVLAGCTSPPESLPSPVRFGAPIPDSKALGTFAISPDGRWLAYSAEVATDRSRRVFVRSLRAAGEQDREINGTLGGTNPFFSADGRALGFFARGGLWRVPIDSRTDPLRISEAPAGSAGATWTEDGRIVFAPLEGHGLMEVPAAGGGPPVPLTTLESKEGELEHGWPHALQGRALVFTVSQRGRDPHVEVLSPTG